MRRNRGFALQAVLDYRKHVENQTQRAVAERGSALESHKRRIDDCEEAVKAYMRFVRANGTLRLADVHACEKQLAALERTAKRHAVAAEEAETLLGVARLFAAEASRDRRAIEILRDRHLAECAAAQRRVEEEDIAESDALRARSEMRRP